eukprot:TRINITY_DN2060_c0_g1_i1.p1 TRINITY_DN2060_c0_g1~~TRINITY_DN2060_c0_g1_i1.p1  ORF type:complete len:1363 (+),score=226.73 TRINITY_DN2060_c0_g1_i1:74-4162(+)
MFTDHNAITNQNNSTQMVKGGISPGRVIIKDFLKECKLLIKNSLLPLLMEGTYGTAFPQEIMHNLIRDCRQEEEEWKWPGALLTYARTLGATAKPLGLIPVMFNMHEHANKEVIKRYEAAWKHLETRLQQFEHQRVLPESPPLTGLLFSSEQANQMIVSQMVNICEEDRQRLLDLFGQSPRLELERVLLEIKQSGKSITAYCEDYQLRPPIQQHLSNLATIEAENHGGFLAEWQLAVRTMDETVSRADVTKLSSYLVRLGEALFEEKKGYAELMECCRSWLDHPNTYRQRWFEGLTVVADRYQAAKRYVDAKFVYQDVLGFYEQQKQMAPTVILEKLARVCMLMGEMGDAMLYSMYWWQVLSQQPFNTVGQQQCNQFTQILQDAAFIDLVKTYELCKRHFGLTVKSEADKESQIIPLIKALEGCGHRLWAYATQTSDTLLKDYFCDQATECYQCIIEISHEVKGLSGDLRQQAATFLPQVKQHKMAPGRVIEEAAKQCLPAHWEIIQQTLQPLRQNSCFSGENEEDFQSSANKVILNGVQQLFELGETLFGTTPWAYAVMGLGSLARGEASPYSTLEFAIVLKETTSSDVISDAVHHLKAMLHWIELQLIALGETKKTVIWSPSQGNIKINLSVSAGFRLDESGTVPFSGKDRGSFLVGTSEKLLNEMFIVLVDGRIAGDPILFSTLQGATFLWGDEETGNTFRTKMFERLKQNDKYEQVGLDLLKEHVLLFDETQEINDVIEAVDGDKAQTWSVVEVEINIKESFLCPTTFIIETLGLYAGINETNNKARLTGLVEKGYISQTMMDALLNCLYFGLELCSQVHRFYGGEYDVVYFQSPNEGGGRGGGDIPRRFILSKEQRQWFKIIYQTMLVPSKTLIKKEILQLRSDPCESLLLKQKLSFQNTVPYEQALQSSPGLVQVLRQRALELRSYYRFEEALRLSRFSLVIGKELEVNQAYQLFVDDYVELMKQYETTKNEHERLRIQEQLVHLPEANGIRGSTLYKQRRWKREVMSITEPLSEPIEPNRLSVEGLHLGRRQLNTEVSTRFIEGLLNKSNEYGTHPVIRIDYGQCSFCLKLYPEYAGNERATYSLMERVVGGGVPESELFQFTDHQGQSYPVLISRTVAGTNIKESYSDIVDGKLKVNQEKKEGTIEKLKSIEIELFSRLFIAALLSSNEDGKTDNIMIHERYDLLDKVSLRSNEGNILQSLTFIDNERCFLPAVAMVDKHIELQMKQFLFCMDQMNESIHPTIKKEINRLDPYRLLNEWLNELEEENLRCLKVFGHDKICQFSNLTDKIPKSAVQRVFKGGIKLPEHPVVLPTVFVNEAGERLFGKLRYLKILWGKHAQITHREVLQRLEPVAF